MKHIGTLKQEKIELQNQLAIEISQNMQIKQKIEELKSKQVHIDQSTTNYDNIDEH